MYYLCPCIYYVLDKLIILKINYFARLILHIIIYSKNGRSIIYQQHRDAIQFSPNRAVTYMFNNL